MKNRSYRVALAVFCAGLIVGCTQGDSQNSQAAIDSQAAIGSLKVLARQDQTKKIIGDGNNLNQNVEVSFIELSDTEVTVVVTAESSLTDAVELSGSCTYKLGSGRWVLTNQTSEIDNISPGLVCSQGYNLP